MPRTTPTILVADDEEMVLNFVGLVLRKAGFRVLPALGGTAALKLCQDGAEELDLALLDIVMPQMDGPQLWTRLRGVYPNLRVLFMSGFSDEEVSRRCGGDTGLAEFLKKPFTASELLQRVKRITEGPATFSA
jgi:DNA-binding response OmpR family regulator